jgi:hypothetical protein
MAHSSTPLDPVARPSRLVAEALVKRHGPKRIAQRAARYGISPELTRAMVLACGAVAIEPRGDRRPSPPA